jgi:hypothetical protein
MMSFTTRIELHSATWQDYSNLHTHMENAGFSRTILGDNGVTYALPTAEYVATGNYTIQQVYAAANTAAAATGKSAAVFVSETTRWRWGGLSPVTKAA